MVVGIELLTITLLTKNQRFRKPFNFFALPWFANGCRDNYSTKLSVQTGACINSNCCGQPGKVFSNNPLSTLLKALRDETLRRLVPKRCFQKWSIEYTTAYSSSLFDFLHRTQVRNFEPNCMVFHSSLSSGCCSFAHVQAVLKSQMIRNTAFPLKCTTSVTCSKLSKFRARWYCKVLFNPGCSQFWAMVRMENWFEIILWKIWFLWFSAPRNERNFFQILHFWRSVILLSKFLINFSNIYEKWRPSHSKSSSATLYFSSFIPIFNISKIWRTFSTFLKVIFFVLFLTTKISSAKLYVFGSQSKNRSIFFEKSPSTNSDP